MPLSLKDSVQRQQPKHTKAVIKLALCSPGGIKRTWCVVEAPGDVMVYQKFFDSAKVTILPSDDENGKRSCHNVESIVAELYQEEKDPSLLGIRDCDYTRYTTYSAPDNIFVTDCRDVEMMMFNASSVIEGLKTWNGSFPSKIESCAEVERYLGYLRIYNELYQTSCTFHDKLTKVSLVWDNVTHTVKPNYKRILFDKFKEGCKEDVKEGDFNKFVEEKRLEEEPYVNVCRGHDMLGLLPSMMIKQEYGKAKDILHCMVEAYSYEDFSKTQLHSDISSWATARNLTIFINNSD